MPAGQSVAAESLKGQRNMPLWQSAKTDPGKLTSESLIGPNQQLKRSLEGEIKDEALNAQRFSQEEVRRRSEPIESGQEDGALCMFPLIFPSLKVPCPLLRCEYSLT